MRAERSEGIVELARPREAVEEAELEEVADAEVGEGAEVMLRKRDRSHVERVDSKRDFRPDIKSNSAGNSDHLL